MVCAVLDMKARRKKRGGGVFANGNVSVLSEEDYECVVGSRRQERSGFGSVGSSVRM